MKKILTNKVIKNFLILVVTLFGIEMIFKAVVGMSVIDWSSLRILMGVSIISLIVSIIMSFCKKWIANIIMFLVVIIASVYSIAQAGFENFLGVYISINTSSQLGAVKEYVRDYIASFLPIFYIILVPLVLLIIYTIVESRILKKITLNTHTNKENWITRGVALVLAILLSVGYYFSLTANLCKMKFS